MPSTFKSPFTSAFKSGINKGQPCSAVVMSIASRTGKPINSIWQSLFKAGQCYRQKFNGQWVHWPTFTPAKRSSGTKTSSAQTAMWQSFIDWCMVSGSATPWQLNGNSTSQKSFMSFCRSFFGRQFSGWSASSASRTGKSKSKRKTKSKAKTSRRSKPKAWSKKRKATKPHSRKTTTAKASKTSKPKAWAFTWKSTSGSTGGTRVYPFAAAKNNRTASFNTRRFRKAA